MSRSDNKIAEIVNGQKNFENENNTTILNIENKIQKNFDQLVD